MNVSFYFCLILIGSWVTASLVFICLLIHPFFTEICQFSIILSVKLGCSFIEYAILITYCLVSLKPIFFGGEFRHERTSMEWEIKRASGRSWISEGEKYVPTFRDVWDVKTFICIIHIYKFCLTSFYIYFRSRCRGSALFLMKEYLNRARLQFPSSSLM